MEKSINQRKPLFHPRDNPLLGVEVEIPPKNWLKDSWMKYILGDITLPSDNETNF